jgi:hypothetical protein
MSNVEQSQKAIFNKLKQFQKSTQQSLQQPHCNRKAFTSKKAAFGLVYSPSFEVPEEEPKPNGCKPLYQPTITKQSSMQPSSNFTSKEGHNNKGDQVSLKLQAVNQFCYKSSLKSRQKDKGRSAQQINPKYNHSTKSEQTNLKLFGLGSAPQFVLQKINANEPDLRKLLRQKRKDCRPSPQQTLTNQFNQTTFSNEPRLFGFSHKKMNKEQFLRERVKQFPCLKPSQNKNQDSKGNPLNMLFKQVKEPLQSIHANRTLSTSRKYA